jgi:ATP-dependent protease Clp ATPase subunit
MTKASIGFGAHMRSNLEDQKVQASHFRDVEPRDLVKYGEFCTLLLTMTTSVSTYIVNALDSL